jgi:hypothetical protein
MEPMVMGVRPDWHSHSSKKPKIIQLAGFHMAIGGADIHPARQLLIFVVITIEGDPTGGFPRWRQIRAPGIPWLALATPPGFALK